MGDGADAVADGRDPHAGRPQALGEGLGGQPDRRRRGPDHVRLDRFHGEAELGETAGQRIGAPVVVGEPLDVVGEGVAARRGGDPGLAHRPAEAVLPPPRPLDVVGRPGQHGAERRAEALREVDPGAVDLAGPAIGGHPRGDDGVEQAGAVEVDAQPVAVGQVDDLGVAVERPHRAAAEVVGLLEADQRRRRPVGVARLSAGGEVGGREHAALAAHGVDDGARHDADAAGLGAQHVTEVLHDHGVARRDVGGDADQVAHRPRRQEDGRLVPEPLGDLAAQRGHRRVAALLLVADLGVGHRPAHRRARPGLGVGVQVDEDLGRHAAHAARRARRRPRVAGERRWSRLLRDDGGC